MIPRDPIEWEESISRLRPSSPAWRAVIRGVWGRVPLTDEERARFLKLSGGVQPPDGGTDRFFVLKGRRGGGTESVARCVVFEARHGGHEVALAPGQVGVIAVICPEHKHAREMLGYVKGLAALPEVKKHLAKPPTETSVAFQNGIEIRVVTANDLAVASTFLMVVLDECARLPGDEATVPDKAIVASIVPGMTPVRGAPRRMLVGITSAYIESGWAFETDRDNFGRAEPDTLVLRGSTEAFNPNVDRAWLERERRKDPVVAMREYGDGDKPPEWQPAIVESWFSAPVIASSVDAVVPGQPVKRAAVKCSACSYLGRVEATGRCARCSAFPFEEGRRYFVAIDAAFARDNFAIAVATSEQLKAPITFELLPRRTVVAYVEALAPPPGGTLSPRECVEQTIRVMRRYQTERVFIDQYCAPTLIESFEDRRCRAIKIDWTGSGMNSKAARYKAAREAMRAGELRLPQDPALVKEFHRVRGRETQTGHERIEAIGRGVDDRVSAVVMACSVALEHPPTRALKDISPIELNLRAEQEQRLAAALFCAGRVH